LSSSTTISTFVCLLIINMLFRNAFKNLSPRVQKAGLRFKTTKVDESAPAAGAGALVAAVGTTFGTYMIADFLSNFLQHPTQKVSQYTNSIVIAPVISLLISRETESILLY